MHRNRELHRRIENINEGRNRIDEREGEGEKDERGMVEKRGGERTCGNDHGGALLPICEDGLEELEDSGEVGLLRGRPQLFRLPAQHFAKLLENQRREGKTGKTRRREERGNQRERMRVRRGDGEEERANEVLDGASNAFSEENPLELGGGISR